MGQRNASRSRTRGNAVRALAVIGGLSGTCAAAAAMPIELSTEGVTEPAIAASLRAAYQLPEWMDGAMSGGKEIAPAVLNEAVERERTRLQKLMADLGYLDATVQLEHAGAASVFRPSLGQLYTVSAIELKGIDQSLLGRDAVVELSSIIADYIGGPASAQAADAMGRRILYRVGQEDFAMAAFRRVQFVSSDNGKAVAVVYLDAGPRMHFGQVTFGGLRRLREPDLRRLIPFEKGWRYERPLVEELRRSLEAIARVDAVHISTGAAKSDGSVVDVSIRIRETQVDPATLRQGEGLGASSGLAALVGLALLPLSSKAVKSRSRRWFLVLAVSTVTLAFAGLVALRAASFLS